MSASGEVGDWGRMSYKRRTLFTLALVQRYGWVCYICGLPIRSRKELTCQHMVPQAKGGMTTFANCRPAHAKCNYGLRDRETTGPVGVVHDGLKAFASG